MCWLYGMEIQLHVLILEETVALLITLIKI